MVILILNGNFNLQITIKNCKFGGRFWHGALGTLKNPRDGSVFNCEYNVYISIYKSVHLLENQPVAQKLQVDRTAK